ncbi:MAG: ABC-2 type transporter [Firmicutes bacterium ADurb.BinA052]|nr:MAG: ABC-2 type transporter [Firmicutes bacterium ADurb.BinA052]
MQGESLIDKIKSSYALVQRNYNLVKRDAGWELVFIVYEVVNVLTIGFIGVNGPKETMNERVLYLVAGALLWGFLSALFHEVAESVAWERWEGTIEYSFMAPQPRGVYMFGVCMWGILYGFVRTAICLAAVTLAFQISLAGANLWAALLTLAASSLAFIGMGLAAAVLPLISPEKGSPATHIFQAVVLLVSGVYYDVSVLPAWVRPLSYISPATYTLRAARAALLEGTGVKALAPDLIMLLVLGVVLIPVGFAVFSAGERYAMRTGKLKRNG